MIKPTDDQLNEAMMQACGWVWAMSPYFKVWVRYSGEHAETEERRSDLTDYCSDRNALSELLAALRDAGATGPFGNCLEDLTGELMTTYDAAHNALAASPRLVVIAALKALGKWPEDWSVDE